MEYQNSVPSVTTTTTEPCYATMAVDPFLVEALQNPRHRLSILRMELDIQKFIQTSSQQQFEFQHFPTSYLRLAAHRVAQHYNLQTMVLDNYPDTQSTRILVKKLPETKYPSVILSDIPTKQSESEKQEHVKIVLKPRPKSSFDGSNGLGKKCNLVRSVEERKEEYDRARARIFSSPGSPQSDGGSSPDGDESYEGSRSFGFDGNTSRVAILRDREKDLTDPDYDRSYDRCRYVRNLPVGQGFNMLPLSFQPPPGVHYDPIIPPPHMGVGPTQIGYGNHQYGVVGGLMNHQYMQWPTHSHSMMYAHTYDQFRHAAAFQAPFCQQQPLSFDYSQNR